MRVLKPKEKQKMKGRRYLLYAFGELILIVLGILLALYINNRNVNNQYKEQIDANILRVYDELGNNINQARGTISHLRAKDSLINLVMNDGLTKEDYQNSLDVPYLCIQNVQKPFDEKAINNLSLINISGNRYKEQLLSEIRELNSLMGNVNRQNDNLAEFISTKSIPLLASSINSFGDLTYYRTVEEDALEFFLEDEAYKSIVAQYGIYTVRQQLEANRTFYKKAIGVYNSLGKEYDLVNNQKIDLSGHIKSENVGMYLNRDYSDTLHVEFVRDSFFIGRGSENKVYLVPLDKNHFFFDGLGQERFFVHFNPHMAKRTVMKLKIFSDRFTFYKAD